jgi:deoxyribodipyrimidine photolyase
MMKILAQNNLFALGDFDLSNSLVYYCPINYSLVQKKFFARRFEQLKKIAPQAVWCESILEEDFDVALSWDATFENNAFGAKIYPRQNRLFDSLPFEISETFTDFRFKAEKNLPLEYPYAVPPWDDEVRRELDYYFKQKKLPLTYLETRNQLVGRDGSTKFSCFLSCGVLDVRYLYNEIRLFEAIHGATKSTGWIIFELLWREYFYWHYQKHPKEYFSKNGLKGALVYSEIQDHSVEELLDLTDEPFFHRAMNELVTTGFLSNRARQIFASIWINDLKLDWRAGARLFEENLFDYDVYSNYGNWMYLAGVGVDPRGKRYFNVAKQLYTYDQEGLYLN